MDEKEFEEQLQALSSRVLSKALSPDEEANTFCRRWQNITYAQWRF